MQRDQENEKRGVVDNKTKFSFCGNINFKFVTTADGPVRAAPEAADQSPGVRGTTHCAVAWPGNDNFFVKFPKLCRLDTSALITNLEVLRLIRQKNGLDQAIENRRSRTLSQIDSGVWFFPQQIYIIKIKLMI